MLLLGHSVVVYIVQTSSSVYFFIKFQTYLQTELLLEVLSDLKILSIYLFSLGLILTMIGPHTWQYSLVQMSTVNFKAN